MQATAKRIYQGGVTTKQQPFLLAGLRYSLLLLDDTRRLPWASFIGAHVPSHLGLTHFRKAPGLNIIGLRSRHQHMNWGRGDLKHSDNIELRMWAVIKRSLEFQFVVHWEVIPKATLCIRVGLRRK